MTAPLITVCVPSYNKARFVEAALDSVGAQTLRDIELIVVEDGSRDGSARIVESWLARHDVPSRLLRHEVNQGICHSLNEALSLARGQYWAGLGADDLWSPHMLERFVARMEELPPRVAVLYGDAAVIDDRGNLLRGSFIERHRPGRPPPEGSIWTDLWIRNFIPAMATLIRVDHLRSIGGYDERLLYEDWDAWLRLAESYSFAFTRDVLTSYRITRRSTAHSEALRDARDATERVIRMKWIAPHDARTGTLEDALYWPGGGLFLYGLGHPAAAGFAARRWSEEPTLQSGLILLSIRMRLSRGLLMAVFRRLQRAKATLLEFGFARHAR